MNRAGVERAVGHASQACDLAADHQILVRPQPDPGFGDVAAQQRQCAGHMADVADVVGVPGNAPQDVRCCAFRRGLGRQRGGRAQHGDDSAARAEHADDADLDELDGVRVYDREARPLAHIALPERCANLCFGGANGNRLFMPSGRSLYALSTNTQGAC